MKKEDCYIGLQVVRDQKENSNYTNGRMGVVIALANIDQRVQVHWTHEKTGKAINVRTWVNVNKLQPDTMKDKQGSTHYQVSVEITDTEIEALDQISVYLSREKVMIVEANVLQGLLDKINKKA